MFTLYENDQYRLCYDQQSYYLCVKDKQDNSIPNTGLQVSASSNLKKLIDKLISKKQSEGDTKQYTNMFAIFLKALVIDGVTPIHIARFFKSGFAHYPDLQELEVSLGSINRLMPTEYNVDKYDIWIYIRKLLKLAVPDSMPDLSGVEPCAAAEADQPLKTESAVEEPLATEAPVSTPTFAGHSHGGLFYHQQSKKPAFQSPVFGGQTVYEDENYILSFHGFEEYSQSGYYVPGVTLENCFLRLGDKNQNNKQLSQLTLEDTHPLVEMVNQLIYLKQNEQHAQYNEQYALFLAELLDLGCTTLEIASFLKSGFIHHTNPEELAAKLDPQHNHMYLTEANESRYDIWKYIRELLNLPVPDVAPDLSGLEMPSAAFC